MRNDRQSHVRLKWSAGVLVGILLVAWCGQPLFAQGRGGGNGGGGGKGGGGGSSPPTESAGNNLSFPVIWAEGVPKALPEAPPEYTGTPLLNGEWWYWWGTTGVDPNITPLSGPPDPNNPDLLLDGTPVPYDEPDLVRAYLQKDPLNFWQAGTLDWPNVFVADPPAVPPAVPLAVHWIDWGDNLESVDWYTRSQVRVEVVLFQDLASPLKPLPGPLPAPLTEYGMRHVSGWGIDEVHGIAESINPPLPPPLPPVPPVVEASDGTQATVYSTCARMTIQKLLVDRDDPVVDNLVWVPFVDDPVNQGCWKEPAGSTTPLVNPPIFNGAVHEAGDGPGYYNAEINVKGRIIYGYTWNVRNLNEGEGCYRLTFSLDDLDGFLNTFFVDGTTDIMEPLEEELVAAFAAEDSEPAGGGIPVLDGIDGEGVGNNLTYIDIRIHERTGGGGGGGKGGGKKR